MQFANPRARKEVLHAMGRAKSTKSGEKSTMRSEKKKDRPKYGMPTSKEDKSEHLVCMRCGRRLRSKESRRLGYGKICYEKMIRKTSNKLF